MSADSESREDGINMFDSRPQTVEEITSTGKDFASEEEKVETRILENDASKGKYGTTQRGLKSRHIHSSNSLDAFPCR